MSEATCALAFEGVSFAYAGASECALEHIDLRVEQDAFALLVGDTGSGKSTLLSLVKPQISPAGDRSGAVRVFGRDVDEMTDEESARTVGFVFQDPDNQIVCNSVWHEMAFGLESLGVSQGEMRRRVAEAGYFFGMGDWFHSSTDALSGGRKQLLSVASMLVMQPSLLLLDEPTAQLDPIATKNFLHALFRVNRELGCTVVVATHAPELMADYATCAFELSEGRVRKIEDLAELKTGCGFEEVRGRRRESSDAASDGHASAPSEVDAAEEDAAEASAAKTGAAETGAAEADAGCLAGRRRGRSLSMAARARSANAPAVDAHGLWFRYERDADWVLRGLDISVAMGEVHALVGGNGSGKSTLLALMAGLQRSRRGAIHAQPGQKALLPQDPKALFAEERVEDELMEWADVGGYGIAEVRAMLERLGLAGRAQVHPYDLSGGQRQLLALGKVLLAGPRLLLLDEPTKGLDRASRRKVARMVDEERQKGVTIVMATHDLEFASAVADRVSLLFDGEVACTEPVDEFFHNNLFYRL